MHYISDQHHGILTAVEEYMQGYPLIVRRWCMRHSAEATAKV
jgi:hypothetical protein